MIELTTIFGKKICIMFKHIKAIESNGFRTLIYFNNKHEMVEERYDFIKNEIEVWLKRKQKYIHHITHK